MILLWFALCSAMCILWIYQLAEMLYANQVSIHCTIFKLFRMIFRWIWSFRYLWTGIWLVFFYVFSFVICTKRTKNALRGDCAFHEFIIKCWTCSCSVAHVYLVKSIWFYLRWWSQKRWNTVARSYLAQW